MQISTERGLLLQAIHIGSHKGSTGRSRSHLDPIVWRHFVRRLCVDVHRICAEFSAGYTANAQMDTPDMRGKFAKSTPERRNEENGQVNLLLSLIRVDGEL